MSGDAEAERPVHQRIRIGERRHQRAELLGDLVQRDIGDLGARRVVDDHPADPPAFGRGQADEEIQPGRPRDLLGEERSHAAPGHPPDHLAHEPAERPAVVPVRGTGLPGRPLGGQRGRHRVPGQQVGQRHGVVDDGQPGPVRQQPADRDVRLPLGGELRPVPGRRPVEVQFAALREQVRARRRGGLGGRVHQLQRVPRPRPGRPGVGQAAPQVDHLAAVAVDADRRAHVAVVLEVAPEHIPDPLEARRHIALDYDHDTDLTTPHRETRCQLPTTGVMVTSWLRCVSNSRTGPPSG